MDSKGSITQKMQSLQHRFPITFAKCEEHIHKYRKDVPDVVTTHGITYDKSVVPILSDDEIERFVNLQTKHPETINDCFVNLMKLLEQQEQQETQTMTRNKKKQIMQNAPMKKIYDSLVNLNEDLDAQTIDKWVLFIKSQNEFSKFF